MRKIFPTQVRFTEDYFIQVRLTQIRLAQLRLIQVRPAQTYCAQVTGQRHGFKVWIKLANCFVRQLFHSPASSLRISTSSSSAIISSSTESGVWILIYTSDFPSG